MKNLVLIYGAAVAAALMTGSAKGLEVLLVVGVILLFAWAWMLAFPDILVVTPGGRRDRMRKAMAIHWRNARKLVPLRTGPMGVTGKDKVG